jgi:hypothetical protein
MMEKFTHGIMVVNPKITDENGDVNVLHFAGYWEQPTSEDVLSLMDELETDETFGLTEMAQAGELEYYPASPEILDHFNGLNFEEE